LSGPWFSWPSHVWIGASSNPFPLNWSQQTRP
jgi:hypothetical protein